MATAAFSIDKFRSQVLSKGLARSNRFEVLITPPPRLSGYEAAIASLLLESTNLPMLNIAAKSLKIFGPTYQRPYTSEYGGEGIQMTFHVDREMKTKRFFDDWMHLIVNPVDFTVGYQNEYTSTIEIRQLDEANNVTYAVQLLEAFPRSMNLMDLNNASSNQTHRLTILMAYRYWKPMTSSQPVAVPRPVVNPQVPSVVKAPISSIPTETTSYGGEEWDRTQD